MFAMQQRYWEMASQAVDCMVSNQKGMFSSHQERGLQTGRDLIVQPNVQPHTNGEQIIQVGEEYLDVSTRKIEGAATRIRRTVREVPVERHIKLQDETVVIERRPPTNEYPDGDILSEREYVVTETREVPVVVKKLRLREEVVVHRKVARRDETVHEKLRTSKVEVVNPRAVVTA